MYFAFLQEAKLFPEPHLPTRLLWHPLPILSPCSHQAPCSEAQPRSYLLSKLSWLSEETALTGGSVVKESGYQCRRCGGSVPKSGRSPGDGHGNPLQCSYLENRVDRGAWQGYRPWGRKESDAMGWLSPVISLFSCCLYLAPWLHRPLCGLASYLLAGSMPDHRDPRQGCLTLGSRCLCSVPVENGWGQHLGLKGLWQVNHLEFWTRSCFVCFLECWGRGTFEDRTLVLMLKHHSGDCWEARQPCKATLGKGI